MSVNFRAHCGFGFLITPEDDDRIAAKLSKTPGLEKYGNYLTEGEMPMTEFFDELTSTYKNDNPHHEKFQDFTNHWSGDAMKSDGEVGVLVVLKRTSETLDIGESDNWSNIPYYAITEDDVIKVTELALFIGHIEDTEEARTDFVSQLGFMMTTSVG